jgi:hypothetical protein
MTKVVPGRDTSTTTLENLDPNAGYSIQVSASNGAGVSELSPAVVAQVFREGMCIYIYIASSTACCLCTYFDLHV